MKIIADFFPVLLFFIAYKLYDLYVATVVIMVASALQVGYHGLRHRKVQSMHLTTLVVVVIFGGLTLALQDRTFVMWKPSIINWLFAMAFLGSQFIGKQTLIERMMGHAIELPVQIWPRLNMLWVIFFFIMGAINIYIAYGFFAANAALQLATGFKEIDLGHCAEQFHGPVLILCNNAYAQENFWVNFKLFGMMGLTLLFAIGQAFYLSRYVQEPKEQETTK